MSPLRCVWNSVFCNNRKVGGCLIWSPRCYCLSGWKVKRPRCSVYFVFPVSIVDQSVETKGQSPIFLVISVCVMCARWTFCIKYCAHILYEFMQFILCTIQSKTSMIVALIKQSAKYTCTCTVPRICIFWCHSVSLRQAQSILHMHSAVLGIICVFWCHSVS